MKLRRFLSSVVLAPYITMLLGVVSVFAQPRIAYIIPDLGTTRHSTYVEVIGRYDRPNDFGTDGLYLNNPGDAVRLRCLRDVDTNTIKIGPCIVSWSGRMIGAHIFVVPTAAPNSDDWTKLNSPFRIPIVVEVNGTISNADTFYVVKPFAFGDKRADAGRIIGEGTLGKRSRRGAMIIDSAIFAGNAKYNVSIIDSDPNTNGNQGYLPFVMISVGNMTGNGGTEIHADANGINGGPGGGGGGGGYSNFLGPIGTDRAANGGDGYTGGGPGGVNGSGPFSPPNSKKKPGVGSGENIAQSNSNTRGSASLSGVPGGESLTTYENAGGGTGHPFGQSGTGCDNYNTCDPPGGYGGGSGARENQRGAGGGYGSAGVAEAGRQGGGQVYGNDCIIPLAGGSGGASGNPSGSQNSSSGGGGGGAISIHGMRLANFDIKAEGTATSLQDIRAGAGSGGGVIIGMRLDNAAFGFVSAQIESNYPNTFLAGGRGRARYDASGIGPSPLYFVGVHTDTMTNTLRKMNLSGWANGSDLHIFAKSASGNWQLLQTLSGYPAGLSWRTTVPLPGQDTLYYICVSQTVPNPRTSQYVKDPVEFFSQSAWNIVRIYGPPEISTTTSLDLGVHKCPSDVLLDTITVENKGESPLEITAINWTGAPGFRIINPTILPDTIFPFQIKRYFVEYRPQPGQTGPVAAQLELVNNDTAAGHSPWRINVTANVRTVALEYTWSSGIVGDTIDLGTLCVGSSVTGFVAIKNKGVDSVTITDFVSSDPSIISVVILVPLPISWPPNNSIRIDVNITGQRLGKAIVPMLVYVSDCPVPDTLWLKFEGVAPRLTLLGTGQFGTVPVGTTSQVVLQLRNDGSSDLEILSIPPVAAPFRFVSANPMPPVTLKTGETVTLVYEFAPTAPGQFSTSFFIQSIANNRSCQDSVQVILAGTAAAVSLVAEPGSLTYPPTLACDSLLDSVLIRNTGGVDVTLLYPAFINGTNSADFTIVSQPRADTLIPPGGTATYVIMFKPLQNATTLRTGILSVRTLAPAVPQVDVPLNGTSASVALNGPRLIDLGLVPLGTPVTVSPSYTNATGATVTVTQIRSSRPTVVTTVPTSFTVADGASQSVDVTVNAGSEESSIDTLWFVTSEPCADSFPVFVMWTSENASLGIQNTLPFGTLSNCETKIDTVFVFNTGRIPVDLIDVTVTGNDASLFRIINPAVATNVTLDSGQSVRIEVEFDPRGSTDGAKVADLVLRARINNQPTSFITKLTGVRATTIPSTPNNVTFGLVDILTTSSQVVTVLNTGTSPIHITSVTIRGSAGNVFTVTTPAMPITLQPGGRLDFTVNFTPEDKITYEDSVIIAFDQPCADERAIALTGTGRLNVEVSIILPEMVIDPTNDNLELPVKAKIVSGSANDLVGDLKMIVRYQAGFFVAHSLSKGTIVRNEVVAGFNELEIDVDNLTIVKGESELFKIIGQATIGPADSTDLDLTFAELTSGTAAPNVRPDNGWLVLDICTAGGPRLIKKASPLTIQVYPNPADNMVDIQVAAYEKGLHTVDVISTTGELIMTQTWTHNVGDPVHSVIFDSRSASTGLYQIRLTTPTRQRFATASIVH